MSGDSKVTLFLAVAGVVALALLPQFADRYYIQLVTRIMVMAIFAMSLGLLVSGIGLVSFGHAAFFGLGAFMLALVAAQGSARERLAGTAGGTRRRRPSRRSPSARWRCARPASISSC